MNYTHFSSTCILLFSDWCLLKAPQESVSELAVLSCVLFVPLQGSDSVCDNKSKRARCSSQDKASLKTQQALLLLCFLDKWGCCQRRNWSLCFYCNGFLLVWLLNGVKVWVSREKYFAQNMIFVCVSCIEKLNSFLLQDSAWHRSSYILPVMHLQE